MSFRRDLMIRVMLNHFHQGAPEVVLASLPEEKAKDILGINIPAYEASYLLNEPKQLIQHVHYSWIAPVIRLFPTTMQPYCLSALPSGMAIQLRETLKVALPVKKLSMAVRLYLLGLISSKLKPKEVLPTPFLPVTSLSPLLLMRKPEIVELIDFLGLYDLAEEIRHIVDKKHLKAIYNCLSLKKQHFLRICLPHKERISIPRLGLDQWKGDCATLHSVLHKRGLLRLGKGISGQHVDFVWHLMHRLDTGRGKILQQYFQKEEIPGVTQALIQEILNLMNFFKKNE